jgi:hypothetical protein
VDWHYILPREPIQTAFIESFSGRAPERNPLLVLADARSTLSNWRSDCNGHVGCLTQAQFAQSMIKPWKRVKTSIWAPSPPPPGGLIMTTK